MPILPSQLILQGSASFPEADTGVSGGARDAATRPPFTQLGANSVIAAVSDGALDARTLTVKGRSPAGEIATEDIVLTGLVEAVGTTIFERILRLTLSASDPVFTVTVRQGAGGPTRASIGANVTKVISLFVDAQVESSLQRARYEKVFWLNSDPLLALQSAMVTLTSDPQARLMIALAPTKDDVASVANRLTSPGLVFTDDNVALAVPTGDLGALEAIGVWFEQRLPAGDDGFRNSWTLRLAGSSL